jgi:hypothetical protein
MKPRYGFVYDGVICNINGYSLEIDGRNPYILKCKGNIRPKVIYKFLKDVLVGKVNFWVDGFKVVDSGVKSIDFDFEINKFGEFRVVCGKIDRPDIDETLNYDDIVKITDTPVIFHNMSILGNDELEVRTKCIYVHIERCETSKGYIYIDNIDDYRDLTTIEIKSYGEENDVDIIGRLKFDVKFSGDRFIIKDIIDIGY